MMKLFTDIDLDGVGCGILAKMAFGMKADVSYCSYRNLNQRVEEFIDNQEHHKAQVFITDLAVNENIEKKLAKRFDEGRHVKVIDHHVTALHFNNYQWGMVKPEYETGKKTCATSLFYDFLVEQNLLNRNNALNEFTDLIRQYDTWEWDENNNITAKRLNDLFYIINREQFEEEMLKRLQENIESFSLTESETLLLDIEERKIERYIQSKNRQMVQAYEDEYCIGIVHAEQYLSELGNALNVINPHLDMVVLLNVGNKKVGFRTIHDEVDVSAFAKKFGGGGHPKASGCFLTDELFNKLVVNVFPLQPIKPDPEKNEYNKKDSSSGTSYHNRSGEVSYIMPSKDGFYRVIHNKNYLDEKFLSFDEAERYVKRKFSSWLSFDYEYLDYLATTLSISVDEIKNNYQEIKTKMITNQLR